MIFLAPPGERLAGSDGTGNAIELGTVNTSNPVVSRLTVNMVFVTSIDKIGTSN